MKRVVIGVVAGLALAGCTGLQHGSPAATAELRNARGEVTGQASLWEDARGVRVGFEVRGIGPGAHGLHLHAVGRCDPPEFTTADDEVTDPTGNSGGRIACGIVRKAS